MNLDFYLLYKDYSNTDLLKIVRQPTDYQPAAVAVATQILNGRQITTEEIQFVDQYFLDAESSNRAKKEKLDKLKYKTADFLEPVLHPTEVVEPSKWVNILLLAIAIEYSWVIFKIIKALVNFLQCSYCTFNFVYFYEILNLLYIPLIFVLVFKKRRWAWILLFADNLYSLILLVGQSYFFLNTKDFFMETQHLFSCQY